MNIFVLDNDPMQAAQDHCDKHVVKMILESAQMLSTAHHLQFIKQKNLNFSDFKSQRKITDFCRQEYPSFFNQIYSASHVHHPCTQWTIQSIQNYQWLSNLALALCDEYEKRYKKEHKCKTVITFLSGIMPLLPNLNLTPFAIAMKNEYKISNNPIECYRNYYLKDKIRFAKWNYSSQPSWWSQDEN